MGMSDWAYLQDGLDAAAVARGVTAGIPKPPGGGQFLFAFNSLTTASGGVALVAALPDFVPMAKGGSIRGCVQRGPGGGALGFAPFLFLAGQGTSLNDRGYLLGLSDEDPHAIVLRKGRLSGGLPASDTDGVLQRSTERFVQGAWLHLRLDMIVNDNGDVALQAFRSDLAAHALGDAPNWQPIPGMALLIDDHLGINSGSVPLTSGRAGFGFTTQDVTRRAFFDHIELWRQL